MPSAPTRAELFDKFKQELLTRQEERPNGRRFSAEEIDTPGSDINLIGAGVAAMGEEVTRQMLVSLRDLTLEAEGEALDRVVFDRYQGEIVRKGAVAAVVPLTFTRTTNIFGAFVYDAGSIVQTVSGVQFQLLQSVTFTGTGLGPVVANARAVDAGLGGNVAVGTITKFITAPPDPALEVTNLVSAAGGDDTESDGSLAQRARNFFPNARRGTAPALVQGALAVEGVRQATVEELVDIDGNLTGFTRLYIADANGQANQLLIDRVRAGLEEVRGYGAALDILGAVPRFVDIVLNLAFTSEDPNAAFEAVRQALVSAIAQLNPNETLLRSLIFSVARGTVKNIVRDDAVPTPAGDVVPLAGEVLRTTLDRITAAAA